MTATLARPVRSGVRAPTCAAAVLALTLAAAGTPASAAETGASSATRGASATVEQPPLTSVPDPADIARSDLLYTERKALEDAFAAGIERMIERIGSEHAGDDTPAPVEIGGYADPTLAARDAGRLQTWIARHDVNRMLYFFIQRRIRPEYTRRPDGTLRFDSALDRSPALRLREAIDADDVATLERLLAEGVVDLASYLPGIGSTTPLQRAVERGRVGMVRRLLAAGADPDTRDRGLSLSPLLQALTDENKPIVRLLAEAGADLDEPIGAPVRRSPIAYALSRDAYSLVELLLELGADPNVLGSGGWTALMDALYAQDLPYARLLLAHSNPLIVSSEPIDRNHRYKSLGRRWFPRTSALHLATLLPSDVREEFVAAVRARAAALDPRAGERLAVAQARRSESDLAWFEGHPQRAIEALREGVAIADNPPIDELTNGDLIVLTMESLTELHELLVIEDGALTESERELIERITEFGGWHAKLHAMLEAVAAGREAYPAERLAAWEAAYGRPSHEDWDYRRLNEWIESVENPSVRDRLFDTLDFFELN